MLNLSDKGFHFRNGLQNPKMFDEGPMVHEQTWFHGQVL